MNRIASALLTFLAFVLICLGAIFVITASAVNALTGGVLVLIAVVLLYYLYRSEKIEAAKPKLINQTVKIKMGGSGQFEEKKLTCKSCGAPLEDKDLKIIEGGIMVKCPYCGTVYALEEAPKW
jgi:DNA-directed RNA polymerase subunit RPC12/RpoP